MKRIKIKWNVWTVAIGVTVLLMLGAGGYAYRILLAPAFFPDETTYVYIDREMDFDALCRQLADSAGGKRIADFRFLADKIGYPDRMLTGCYAIRPKMTNQEVLNLLRRGHQTAVKLTFNNIRLKKELAERLSRQLMLGEEELLAWLNDPEKCDSLGFSLETISALFLPNTYEVYWNISVEKLMQRMKKEYDNFWNESRKKRAGELGLTPIEVAILASIAEEETAVSDELPIVAGLYLNRLRVGMPLQADPTVKFAVGDFSLRRILYEHLEVESPYNTYKYAGLPPGPIRIPSIKGLNAVLHYMEHQYMYMCAREDFSGRHNFSTTLAQHNRYAARYREELNRRGIR